ncbi:hypothetical protein GCM10027059_50400 [Myceligenerans halotolerans]
MEFDDPRNEIPPLIASAVGDADAAALGLTGDLRERVAVTPDGELAPEES